MRFLVKNLSLLLGVLALGACAQTATPTPSAELSIKTEARLSTPTIVAPADPAPEGTAGNYLASRAALQAGDFGKAARYLGETLARDPNNQGLIERAAALQLLAGNIDAALPLCEQWAKNKPQSLLPNLVRFLVAAKNGQGLAARGLIETLVTTRSNQLTVPLLQAWLDIDAYGLDAGLLRLEKLIEHPTAGGIIALHAALMSEYARDYDRAAQFYGIANARFSVIPLRLVLNTGQLLERQNDPAAAQTLYQNFIDRSPNNYVLDTAMTRVKDGTQTAPANIRTVQEGLAQVLFDLATSFEGQQSNELALIYAQLAAYMQPDFAFNRLLLAELFEDYEQFDRSAALYDGLRDHPDFGWTVQLRLARNWDKLDRDAEAITLLEQMRARHPNRTEPIIMLGDLYRNNRDFAAAIDAYSEALERLPKPYAAKDWPLFYARGIAFEQAKLWPSAEQDFQQALQLSPDQPYVLNYLAYTWVERGEKLPEALSMLQRAVALAPEDPFIIDSLGWAYYRLGQYATAITYLERAVQIRPFDPQLLDHYGDALWQTGKQEQARQQWQRAQGFAPSPELAQSLTDKLRDGLRTAQEIPTPIN